MKKVFALLSFALLAACMGSSAYAGEWQPFFTCDPTGTGGTCSYTLTELVVMPTGSYTTNTIIVNDGMRFRNGWTGTYMYTKTTSLTLKDGSGNSVCSSPFTGTGQTGSIFGSSNITIYTYTITCGSTGLTGGNNYTLTITGTVNTSDGTTTTSGPYLFVNWTLS